VKGKQNMTNLRLNFRRITPALVAITLAVVSASSQEKKIGEKSVPAAVIKAFKASFPTATIKGFAREKENGKVFYEIESKDGETTRDVLYKPDGSVAEIEETVTASDLPSAIQDMIRTKYAAAVITKAEKTMQGETVTYEVVIKKGKRRITLEFDANGNSKNQAK
jgi:uncharacterized membrane protein YkoI